MNYDSMMPRDPFADDPNDPASFLEPEEPAVPLTPEEREATLHDLAIVRECQEILLPRGILGVCFLCEDCDVMHYYDWEIMAANMQASLTGELAPVHEPGADPAIDAYVPWDYALGYLDGREGR
ncbi:hypothetical protein B841_02940 [Corynebacterium maris DSM 45190]|uniref:DUF5319 domain-containing protein n=1 Tax=Corynebacterium maris DSM 45190 TaxID=1224163 RepID=S5TGP5_9CORY|nr:DUF5319 domain-containing protein [Corynebacterium maris]AGS34071.1 hypothetical protein B841_02940 [Corynebacterium maris DSM 45190]MDO5454423.1 DUF5319 domain-containing protein [Corynebacterium sp.]